MDAKCAFCGEPIPPDGPSADFCSEACQSRWTRREQRTEGLPPPTLEFEFEQIREIFEEIGRSISESWSAIAASLGVPGNLTGSSNPDDPTAMERALLARRRRNTGPAARSRPPRTIGVAATMRSTRRG